MLVLTRKIGEELVIDGNTRIAIQRIRGRRVTLSIEAPKEVSIRRHELVFDLPEHLPSLQEQANLQVMPSPHQQGNSDAQSQKAR